MPTADAIRKVLARTPDDALLLFALGKKLIETRDEASNSADFAEAIVSLQRANAIDPTHLATYHMLATAFIAAGRSKDARPILEKGIHFVSQVGEGMGRDLGPAMREMLNSVNRPRGVRD